MLMIFCMLLAVCACGKEEETPDTITTTTTATTAVTATSGKTTVQTTTAVSSTTAAQNDDTPTPSQTTAPTTTRNNSTTLSKQLAAGVPSDYSTDQIAYIGVNQVGYETGAEKRAVIRAEVEADCYLVNAVTNRVVYTGQAADRTFDTTNMIYVTYFDFSDYNASGSYYVQTSEGRSLTFSISGDPYQKLNSALLKMFYYQRCGCTLASNYVDAGYARTTRCHQSAAILVEEGGVITNTSILATGGWHDAGDYGRYMTPGCAAVWHLLYAYDLFESGIDTDRNQIPESGNGIADVLDEVRYELNWMLKMQDKSTGGVYFREATANFANGVTPEWDVNSINQMYMSRTTLHSSAAFAAAMATAARVYRTVDSDFAAQCLSAAKSAYTYSLEHQNKQTAFSNASENNVINAGEYGDSNAWDLLYWASAELYRTTGEQKYEDQFIEIRENRTFSKTGLSCYDSGGFGTISYLMADNTDAATRAQVYTELIDGADAVLRKTEKNAYRISLQSSEYVWGSNGQLMNQTNLLCAAAEIAGTGRYDQAILDHLSYLFGTNVLAKSYVTGFGANAARNAHWGMHMATKEQYGTQMPAGFVVGGPNSHEGADISNMPAACYEDAFGAYTTNEVTIYWNATTLFTTAYLCK